MRITDYPMACCGMVEASRIMVDAKFTDETCRYYREKTNEDWDNLFKKIEEHQISWTRNCALITLADVQYREIGHALRNGYTKVFEFFNPNSNNMVGLYTKTLWSKEEWIKMQEEGYKTPIHATSKAEEYEIAV